MKHWLELLFHGRARRTAALTPDITQQPGEKCCLSSGFKVYCCQEPPLFSMTGGGDSSIRWII